MSSAGMGKLVFYDWSNNNKFQLYYETAAGLNLTEGLRIGHLGSFFSLVSHSYLPASYQSFLSTTYSSLPKCGF